MSSTNLITDQSQIWEELDFIGRRLTQLIAAETDENVINEALAEKDRLNRLKAEYAQWNTNSSSQPRG